MRKLIVVQKPKGTPAEQGSWLDRYLANRKMVMIGGKDTGSYWEVWVLE